ncbi:hypothetical protein HHK36_022767 [Tetracentron sinense]|uniref:Uncharacterized protein n=1 Tax=Tetracentron sinense TaxID=13715 RepID=A0A834YRP6_TETSI|nr:hypothetical protein HHK36_022767 [Tetracentron sinense]
MAAICCVRAALTLHSRPRRIHGFFCSSSAHDKRGTPRLLKIAVSGVTELLRLFSPEKDRSDRVDYKQKDEPSVFGMDDVLMILKSDYENAYFVTGNFTPAIYTEDCTFEDPTITFRGKDLYTRNLKLLVPFFDGPSIELQNLEKGVNSETNFLLATWKLRTYLKLPWKPLISIEGSTVYDLDDEFKVRNSFSLATMFIVEPAENWDISALEAIGKYLLLVMEGMVNKGVVSEQKRYYHGVIVGLMKAQVNVTYLR